MGIQKNDGEYKLDVATSELLTSDRAYAYFFIRGLTEGDGYRDDLDFDSKIKEVSRLWDQIVQTSDLEEIRNILKQNGLIELEAINPGENGDINERLQLPVQYSHFLKDGFVLLPISQLEQPLLRPEQQKEPMHLAYIPIKRY